jgi:hypothetical protein
MEHHIPKWAPIAIAALVLFLLFKAKSSGGAQATVQAAEDPRDRAAKDLQLSALADQYKRSQALADLDLTVRKAQAQVATDYGTFYHGLATGTGYGAGYKCPTGKPRIDPATGQVYCRQKAGGGLTLGTIISGALSAYQQGLFKVTGRRGSTPPIAPGRLPGYSET